MLENFCRNGGKKFDVGEGEVTSVKGDKVQKQDELSLEISFNVSFIYKAAFFLETTNLCKIVLVIKSSYDDWILILSV